MHEPGRQLRFTPEQVKDIIGRASRLGEPDDRLSYEDVVDIAAQVGVDEDAVAAAIEHPAPIRPSPVSKRTVADYLLACLCLRPLEPRPMARSDQPFRTSTGSTT